ncbi:MAG: hypothetical protein HKP08_10855 [Flavobacteriaceae bacterium]|nr:hypothetical protein [Flavobacteriaceae bacterium]
MDNKLRHYYESIHDELHYQIEGTEYNLKILDTIKIKLVRSLELLALKNKDSLYKLENSIGALGTSYTLRPKFSVMNEFINQNFISKVENDSLKTKLVAFERWYNDLKALDDYVFIQYSETIEPYYNKKINYASAALAYHRAGLIPGGPKTNYSLFLEDMELWNILTFKLETTNHQITGINKFIESMKILSTELENELGVKNGSLTIDN